MPVYRLGTRPLREYDAAQRLHYLVLDAPWRIGTMKPQLVTILGLARLYSFAGCNRKSDDDIDATASAAVQVSPEDEDRLQDMDTTGGDWNNSSSEWQTQNSSSNSPSWSN